MQSVGFRIEGSCYSFQSSAFANQAASAGMRLLAMKRYNTAQAVVVTLLAPPLRLPNPMSDPPMSSSLYTQLKLGQVAHSSHSS